MFYVITGALLVIAIFAGFALTIKVDKMIDD